MALQQTMDGYAFENHKIDAAEKYPEEELNTAVEKYAREHRIEGGFFLGDAGDRFVWGPGK